MEGHLAGRTVPRASASGSFTCCGVRIDAFTLDDAAQELVRRAVSGASTVVHLCNAHVVTLAARDHDYATLLNRGDLNLPDGKSVAWIGRYLGFDFLRLSVPGPDLFQRVIASGRDAGIRHYLYGSTPEVIVQLAEELASRFPGADIAGYESPPFRELTDEELEATAQRIEGAEAHIVWVGLGTPKQDRFIDRLDDRLDIVLVPVGAAFDFVAGTKGRAPVWMRDLGLEWLYRLATEPRRLFGRYLVGNLRFLACAIRTAAVTRSPGADLTAADPARPVLGPQLWRRKIRRILVAADAAVIGTSSFLAYQSRVVLEQVGAAGPFQNELATALGVLPLWLGILALFGCYHPAYLSAGGDALRRFAGGTAVGVLVLGFLSFVLRLDLSRFYVGVLFSLVLLFGTVARSVVRHGVRRRRTRGELIQRVIVVGANDEARQVAELIAAGTSGYEVVGFVGDDVATACGTDDQPPILGRPEDALDLAFQHGAGLVLIVPSAVEPGTAQDIAVALEGSPVDVAIAPSLFQVVTRRVAIESVGNVPLLHVDQIRLSWGRAAIKRTVDVLTSATLLVLLSPVMIAAAVAMKVHDGGPMLFRQKRVGRDGRHFALLKFRTMVPDAESRLVEVEDLNEVGHGFFKIRDDPRVTRVGRVLRKWSIDETPQLWNVLRGQMSMVGPRPPLPEEVARYEDWHLRRLRVKPGITGIWQVSGRSEVPFDEAVRLDLFYIENWSLGLDLFLLAKTIPAVLGRTGAY